MTPTKDTRYLMEIFKDGEKEAEIDITDKTVQEITDIRREQEAMGREWGFRKV